MPQKFVFMLKTYAGDIKFAKRLITSFLLHNEDQIYLYVVVPQMDLQVFAEFKSKTVFLLAEETVPCRTLPASSRPRDSGYINQQVLKLGFYKLGIADSYMVLDSDAVFIRGFRLDDFFHFDGLPYQVLVQDKLLMSDGIYYEATWRKRSAALGQIASFLGHDDSELLKTCHGLTIFQSKVLRGLEEFLLARDMDFLDVITFFGFEFSWYNYFLQMTEPVIHAVEPLFYTIHSGEQLVSSQLLSATESDYARAYIGIVVNGNFQHFGWPASIGANRVLSAATYLRSYDLFRITFRFGTAFFLSAVSFPVIRLRRLLLRKS